MKNAFETKLYIPRNVEGKPNKKELEIIREFDNRLRKYKEFIGISPLGSVMKGYNLNNLNDSIENRSDLDLGLMVDVSGAGDEVINNLYAEAKEIAEKCRTDENGVYVSLEFFPIDLASLKKEAMDDLSIKTIASVCRLVTGHRIDYYRKEIKTIFNELDKDKQERILKRVLKLIEGLEVKSSIGKLLQRKPELENRREEIINAQKVMWKKRIENILYGREQEDKE